MPSDPPFHPLRRPIPVDRPVPYAVCLSTAFRGGHSGVGCSVASRAIAFKWPLAPTFCPLFVFATTNILRSSPRRVRKHNPKTASQADPAAGETERHSRPYIQLSRADQLFSFRHPVFGRANLRLAPSAQGSHHRIHAPPGSSRRIGEPAAYQPSVPCLALRCWPDRPIQNGVPNPGYHLWPTQLSDPDILPRSHAVSL